MKKTVILCLIWVMILSVCPVFGNVESAEAENPKIYFKKDFDDSYYGKNRPFDNMTVRPSGNVIETALETDGNRYMKFEKYPLDYSYAAGEGNSNFEKIISKASNEKKMVVQFDVMLHTPATKMVIQITDNTSAKNTYGGFVLEGSKVFGEGNILTANKWVTIRAFYDFSQEKPCLTVYAGDKNIGKKEINIENFWRVRFHSEKSYAAGIYGFDNFIIYSGEPIFDNSVYNLSYVSIVEADNVSIKSGVSALSIYGDYIIKGVKGKSTDIIKHENGEILISSKKIAELYDAETNEEVYLPYEEAFAKIEKTAIYDDRGFLYWSDNGEALILTDDEKWVIYNLLIYERPTKAYLSQNVKKTHPRLSIPEGRIDEIKQEIESNKYAKWYFASSKAKVTSYYNAKLLNADNDQRNVMMKARDLLGRVKTLSLYYHLMEMDKSQMGEEYETNRNLIKTKIWDNVNAVINDEAFPHWQPDSGLDNAEMAAAVAYAYDWLYDDWNDEQRKAMEKALYEKALVYAEQNYCGQIGNNSSWWINSRNSNQNAVINGGYILCAVVLMDVYPETASLVLEKALRSIESFQNSFYPDGAWLEGVTYWTYSMNYWIPVIQSLKIVYGTDFGLLRAPGLEKSPEYIMYASSINENNNYHDSELNIPVYNMGSFYPLAKMYEKPEWADWKLTYDWYHQIGGGITTLINFPVSAKITDINLPKDGVIYRDAVGSFREEWLNGNGMYLSYHGGHAYPEHGHCDTGTFVYEYDGVRFAVDVAPEAYSLSGDRLNTYRTRPEGHNCLVINPDSTTGHNTTAFSPIEKFETNENGGFAILDMSETYKDYATNVRRGFKTDDNRNSMIIRDEIKGIKKQGEVYWFMHIKADTSIEIIDAKTAVLTNSGKSIKFELLTDARVFELKELKAEPLEQSPTVEGQSDNSDYKKIAVVAACSENEDMYIQVKLSPTDDDIMSAQNVAIDDWKAETFTDVIYTDEDRVRVELGDKDLFSAIALYKDKKIYKIILAENNSYDGMTAISDLTNEEGFSAKIFVWNSAEKLKPLTETLPINILK